MRNGISGRDVALLATGAAVMLVASRVMPPIAGRGIGVARFALGGDPFAALARDHRMVLGLLRSMEDTSDDATIRRSAMLFQVKRMLTAHALAEEDVLYPLLHDDTNTRQAAERLYHEHAEMKIRLSELERMPKDDPRWVANLRELRRLIEVHAQDEEENEFPRLRASLDEQKMARLAGDLQREKALIV